MLAVAATPDTHAAAAAAFDRVLATIEGSRGVARISADDRRSARAAALALLDAGDGAGLALDLAVLAYAAELLSTIAVELAADPDAARRVIDRLQSDAGLPRIALGRELLRTGRLRELGVEIATEVVLALLQSFAGAAGMSLWTLDDSQPRPVAHAGATDPADPATTAAAAAVLRSTSRTPVARSGTVGVRIAPMHGPVAAVIAHDVDAAAPHVAPLLAAAAPRLAVLLEQDALRRGERSQESVTEAVERRLARLRFDLHDGPQQDVHLLAGDLRLFREQLRPIISGDPDEARVLGRLDDLEAQLVALDGDLRRLSRTVQSPFLAAGSLQDALAVMAEMFAQRTGVEPRTECRGDLTQLTDSQQIAILALVREALSNIRKHSDASHVAVEVVADPDGLHVEISDDGAGFDPETTLVRAARAGHLGLVGMHERVRMLGGRTQIESRPGGPTVIRGTLPRWAPPDPA